MKNDKLKTIASGSGSLLGGATELWRSRHLIWLLGKRDVAVRYKQTALGVAWVVIQPLALTFAFTFLLGRLGSVPSDGHPYQLFVMTAMVVWQLFAAVVNLSGNSLVANQVLLTKVYFPRLAIPMSAIIPGTVDFLVTFGLLILFLVFYGVPITYHALFGIYFILLALAFAVSVGILFGALAVYFRDFRYVVPFTIQALLLVSPVAYPASALPISWHPFLGLNPMSSALEGWRWAVLGSVKLSLEMQAVSAIVTGVLFIFAVTFFRKVERFFADSV